MVLSLSHAEQRHAGEDIEILRQREALYERAKQAQPERWSGNTRDWSRKEVVLLNPDNTEVSEAKKFESAA